MASPSMEDVPLAPVDESGPSARVALDVQQERIVCIEHPCIIKDIDNGVKSLGGEQQLQKVRVLGTGTIFPSLIPSR